MSVVTPTIAPGQRVIIRIVATIVNTVNGRLDYMVERFTIDPSSFVALVDGHMALIEVRVRIIRSTGRASFLVLYEGHPLRVHAQQIKAESEVVRW